MVREGIRDINLVSWKEAHFHALYSLANNPKIAMNLRDNFPQPYTIHDAKHWIEHNQRFHPAQNFAVEYQGILAGSISSEMGKDELRTNVALGFWIGEPFWGKGIATEAVRLYTAYLLEKFEVERIFAQVYDFNGASMHVLEKAGFVPEAILKKAYVKQHQVGDLFQYVLVRGE